MRATEVRRRLESLGFVVEAATGGGSHFKIKREGQRTSVLSLHNGLREDVSAFLLKKLAKQLNIDPAVFD